MALKLSKPCDFEGWATKNDLLCDDGVIIQSGAFNIKDGEKVPVVWNHQHNTVGSTLGHAILENRKAGVWAYVYLNDTDAGKHAKTAVKHGDLDALSICATNISMDGNLVVHGVIRELSLVLAGANPGARIQSTLSHGLAFDESDDEAIIISGERVLMHATAFF